jgi:hypothetical protein
MHGRVARDRGESGLRGSRSKVRQMRSDRLRRAIGTLPARCAHHPCRGSCFGHHGHAVMPAIAAAACRQVCLARRRDGEKRSGKGQPEQGQQHDGEKLTQWLHSSIASEIEQALSGETVLRFDNALSPGQPAYGYVLVRNAEPDFCGLHNFKQGRGRKHDLPHTSVVLEPVENRRHAMDLLGWDVTSSVCLTGSSLKAVCKIPAGAGLDEDQGDRTNYEKVRAHP